MASDLDQAYIHCQRIAKAEAKNFYYAFRTLPYAKRRAIYAVYAFCDTATDVADEDLPPEEKRRLLSETRDRLHNPRLAPDDPFSWPSKALSPTSEYPAATSRT